MPWNTVGPMPAASDSSLNFSTSASSGALKRQARGEDANICIASAPMSTARPTAFGSPPAADTCAPMCKIPFPPILRRAASPVRRIRVGQSIVVSPAIMPPKRRSMSRARPGIHDPARLARLGRPATAEESPLFPENQNLGRDEDRAIGSDHDTGEQDEQEVT